MRSSSGPTLDAAARMFAATSTIPAASSSIDLR